MKPKAIISDFDGTLLSPPFYHFFNSSFLKPLLAGIYCRLPAKAQSFIGRPTPQLRELLKRQEEEVKIIILTNRKNTEKSRRKLEYLLKNLGLKPEKIYLRPASLSPFEHKKVVSQTLKEEYEIVAILEDERRFHQIFAEIGPISWA